MDTSRRVAITVLKGSCYSDLTDTFPADGRRASLGVAHRTVNHGLRPPLYCYSMDGQAGTCPCVKRICMFAQVKTNIHIKRGR